MYKDLRFYLDGLDEQTCKAVIDYDWNGLVLIHDQKKGTHETVIPGNKYLTQTQKENSKQNCPFEWTMRIDFKRP